jgi:hypothetical protein
MGDDRVRRHDVGVTTIQLAADGGAGVTFEGRSGAWFGWQMSAVRIGLAPIEVAINVIGIVAVANAIEITIARMVRSGQECRTTQSLRGAIDEVKLGPLR